MKRCGRMLFKNKTNVSIWNAWFLSFSTHAKFIDLSTNMNWKWHWVWKHAQTLLLLLHAKSIGAYNCWWFRDELFQPWKNHKINTSNTAINLVITIRNCCASHAPSDLGSAQYCTLYICWFGGNMFMYPYIQGCLCAGAMAKVGAPVHGRLGAWRVNL